MDNIKVGAGDNDASLSTLPKSPGYVESAKSEVVEKSNELQSELDVVDADNQICDPGDITAQAIDDNEMKLKKRIAQCKNIIESLKFELNEEKAKLGKEKRTYETHSEPPKYLSGYLHDSPAYMTKEDLPHTSSMYSACVDSKLNCDESLIEYEKQLEKYQSTLNRAHIEKKNAIRKQMLAKAYKLKLLEVENQCNIELLRVKQSLQCLEPLQMIANKWKDQTDDVYDINNFELIPSYPELFANSGSDISAPRDELHLRINDASESRAKDDSVSADC